MDDLVVGFSLNYWEDLMGKLRGDLVHCKGNFADVKDSNFGSSY